MIIHPPICHADPVTYKREEIVDILDKLFWSVQPPKGLIKGDYYKEQMRFGPGGEFDPGHLGTLEVVCRDGKIQMVEFNELCTPTYYMTMQQNMSKRLSNYCFFQAKKWRTSQTGHVWNNGIPHVEEQMVNENRLTGKFELVTGASNSVNRAMLPLAEKIAAQIDRPSGKTYYGLSVPIGPGITARLQVVLENGKYVQFMYDEIFADTQEEIEDPDLKCYYRQSRYFAPEYVSNCGMGFNKFVDAIGENVIQEQSLTHLPNIVFDPAPAEMCHYPEVAAQLEKIIIEDGALVG